MASISSFDHRHPMRNRRLKPLILRDYLLDDLSSCSSNGFKSFPRRQCRILDAEIKRSGLFHYNRRLTCGFAISQAVQKALLSAVKLLTFPSSVKSPSGKRDNKKGLFSIHFWKKPSRREINNVDGEIREQGDESEQEIKRWRLSFEDFLQESVDQPSDCISCICATGSSTLSNGVGDSSNFGNDVVEDVTEKTNGVVVMMSGDCVGSDVNDNREVS